MTTPEEAEAVYRAADCLYDRAQVEAALDRMAAAITAAVAGSEPLVLPVMVGGLIPAGRLLERFDFPLHLDYVHASRYRGRTEGGELHWLARPAASLAGRTVLLIDDILDEGHTLAAIHESCRQGGAAAVYSAVLVEKLHQRKNAYRADFVGLTVDDRYVFGYGMDYKGYWRNAPGIYAVSGRG